MPEELRDDIGVSKGETPSEIADRYFIWLNDRVPFVRARHRPEGPVLHVLGIPLIRLGSSTETLPTSDDIHLAHECAFPIIGGLLAHPGGHLAFVVDDESTQMVLRRFRPSLPWWLYRMTQLPLHRLIAATFARVRCLHISPPRRDA